MRYTRERNPQRNDMSQQPQSGAAGRAPAPSQTMTHTAGQEGTGTNTTTAAPRILRLRGRHEPGGRSVQWAEDVVDNEGLGRKSSKGNDRLWRTSFPRTCPEMRTRVLTSEKYAVSTTNPRLSATLATNPPRTRMTLRQGQSQKMERRERPWMQIAQEIR